MANKKGINWDFISAREGGAQLQGYLPMEDGNVIDKSGLTVATGFDVGQMSEEELMRSPLSDEIKAKLSPYVGKKGQDALALTNEMGVPNITPDQSSMIDAYSHKRTLDSLKSNYNKSSGKNFDDLSSEQQTVVASVGFQYGSNLESATPGFWKQVTTDDWDGAHSNLRDFKDKYPSRRNLEADLIKPIEDKIVEELAEEKTIGSYVK